LDVNLKPRDNTKDSSKSQDKCSPRRSPAYASLSSSRYFKKNIGGSANAFRDRSAEDTVNNDVEINEEAPVTTASS